MFRSARRRRFLSLVGFIGILYATWWSIKFDKPHVTFSRREELRAIATVTTLRPKLAIATTIRTTIS